MNDQTPCPARPGGLPHFPVSVDPLGEEWECTYCHTRRPNPNRPASFCETGHANWDRDFTPRGGGAWVTTCQDCGRVLREEPTSAAETAHMLGIR